MTHNDRNPAGGGARQHSTSSENSANIAIRRHHARHHHRRVGALMTAPLALPNLPQGAPPQLTTVIQDAVLNVLLRHGARAFEAPRHAAIAHEAGHAIVGTHEGFTIRRVTVFARSAPSVGQPLWGGLCLEAGGPWTTGPDSTADEDLRRARLVIAGLAGEAITGLDRPGSSLDELALSQLIGLNAAVKLDDPNRTDVEYPRYAERLWHERVWNTTIDILYGNLEPFRQVIGHLDRHERVKGGALRKVLAQVKEIAP